VTGQDDYERISSSINPHGPPSGVHAQVRSKQSGSRITTPTTLHTIIGACAAAGISPYSRTLASAPNTVVTQSPKDILNSHALQTNQK